MTRIILLISCLFLLSCAHEQPRKLYKTDSGYCYQDSDMLWHMYVYNTMTGTYIESTSSTAPIYDNSTTYSSSEVGVDVETSATENGMSETTGEDTGGSDGMSDADSSDGGMGESSGSDTGGFDGGGGDSGGGDGGGGGE